MSSRASHGSLECDLSDSGIRLHSPPEPSRTHRRIQLCIRTGLAHQAILSPPTGKGGQVGAVASPSVREREREVRSVGIRRLAGKSGRGPSFISQHRSKPISAHYLQPTPSDEPHNTFFAHHIQHDHRRNWNPLSSSPSSSSIRHFAR